MNENNYEAQLALINHKFDALNEEVSDMKIVVKEVAQAIVKLTLIEERQAQAAQVQKRMFEKLDAIDIRVASLEKTDLHQSQVTNWITNGACALGGVILMYAARQMGLM